MNLVDQLVDVVLEIVAEAKTHPLILSAQAIAERTYGAKKITGQLLAMIEPHLNDISQALFARKLGITVHPVSQYFFDYYLGSPPESLDEARLCLPIGAGKKTKGLRIINSSTKNDLCYLAWIDWNYRKFESGGRNCIHKSLESVGNGVLAPKVMVAMVQNASDRVSENSTPSLPAIRALNILRKEEIRQISSLTLLDKDGARVVQRTKLLPVRTKEDRL